MQPGDTHHMESTQPRQLPDTGATVSLEQMTGRSGWMPAVAATRRGTRLRPPPNLTPSATALLKVLRYRWLLALGLGLAAATVAALVTYVFVPKPKPAFVASGLLSITSGPARPMLNIGSREQNIDFPTYRRTQIDFLKSQTIALEAIKRLPADFKAKFPKLDSDKLAQDDLARKIQSRLVVDTKNSNEWPSQIVPIALSWPTADEAVVILKTLMAAFVDTVDGEAQQKRRDLLQYVEASYKENQNAMRNLRTNLRAHQSRLAGLQTQQEQDTRRELEFLQSEMARKNMLLHEAEERMNIDKSIKGVGQKGPEKTFEVTPQLIEDYLLKDAQIRSWMNEIGRVDEYIAKLRLIASNVESLPEYEEFQRIKTEYQKRIKDRSEELRPTIKKKLAEAALIRPDSGEDPWDVEQIRAMRTTIKSLEGNKKDLSERIDKLSKERRNEEMTLMDQITQEQSNLGRVEDLDRRLFDEKQALALEVSAKTGRVSVVQDPTEAEPETRTDTGTVMRTVGLAGIGAFLLTALGVGWWEFRSRRIHTTDELAGQLGLRMIGTVPTLPDAIRRQPIPTEGQDMYWHSRLTEAIDSITTLLLHEAGQAQARVLLITSAVGHEGKTTLATHLATSLARAGKRTLLIDGDLVHPTGHLAFNEGLEPGLSELLRGQYNVPDVVRPTGQEGLWMITAGQADSVVVQNLARDAMQPLLERLRAEYDVILIDSSPVLPLAHALLIGKHVDAAVLSVRRDVSRVMPVYAAHQRLATLGIPVLGAVFMEQNNPGYDSYVYSEAPSAPQQQQPVGDQTVATSFSSQELPHEQ